MAGAIIAEVLEVLELAQTVYPEIAALVPVIDKIVSGEATTDADAVAVITVRQTLKAKALPNMGNEA